MPFLILLGAVSGYLVVPMNALLQHRGHHLVGAGRSIAVQNFNENASILAMIAIYSLLLASGLSIYWVIALFGLFVAGTMTMVLIWYLHNRSTPGDLNDEVLEAQQAAKQAGKIRFAGVSTHFQMQDIITVAPDRSGT